MMTEDEARNKTCWHTLNAAAVSAAPKGEFRWHVEPCRCIASACMAWRWAYDDEIFVPQGAAIPGGYVPFSKATSSTKGVTTTFDVCRPQRHEANGQIAPQRGRCGLAGAP